MINQEKGMFRLEIDPMLLQNGPASPITTINSSEFLEFEILPPIDYLDKQRFEIYQNITDIDGKLNFINDRVDALNRDIDSLTNHADGIDYTIAIASGIIAGLIDSFFVGEFSLERANEWGDEKVENFVIKTAQKQGYKGDSLPGAIKYLEDKYPIAADKVTNDFGGGKQHHLRDFSHHPTPIGLFFSLLTQFTKTVYGTNTAGVFTPISLKEDDLYLIGKNIPEKITFGVTHWFFHMVSDIAGASGTVRAGGAGTGLPGPVGALLKELSVLPIFKKVNKQGYKEFSVWVSKLFNGTLLGKRDENGKLTEAIKFDLRTEIGIAHELGRQTVPVLINECVVRSFYFIRQFAREVKENNIQDIPSLKNINWKSILPFKNRTIVRMLSISTGTFMAVDIIDAAIRSGGFNHATLLRINYIGVGRFVIAISADTIMGVKKAKKENHRIELRAEQLQLLNAKIFYKEADVWIEAKNAEEALQKVYISANQAVNELFNTWGEIQSGAESREKYIKSIREKEPEFADTLAKLLKRGF